MLRDSYGVFVHHHLVNDLGPEYGLCGEMNCAKCGERIGSMIGVYEKHGDWRHRICPRRKRPRGAKKAARISRKLFRVDQIATQNAHFKDSESYVCWDGREVLKGIDWKNRVEEVCQRDKGMCQWCPEPHSCDGDVHHIVKRSKLRDDRMGNLSWVCRQFHDKHHNRIPKWSTSSAAPNLSSSSVDRVED